MTHRRGFTLVELVLGLIIMGIVATVLARVFVTQQRLTVAQVEQASMQSNVRTGILIVANELRELAAGVSGGADIKSITPTTLAYRAMRSLALACRIGLASVRVRASPIYGARPITAGQDSMLVFVEHDPGRTDDDEWVSLAITDVTAATCPDGAPALRLGTNNPPIVSDVQVDAPVRTFEIMEIAPVIAGSHNWLGAHSLTKPGGEPLTPVAGPITVAGLTFSYFDAAGNPTTTRSNVRSIRIVLRGQSDWDVRPGGALGVPLQPLTDSLVTTVTLRNARQP
jgi:prepilin-type N-terminal cleavage/methylation domain-containing protein